MRGLIYYDPETGIFTWIARTLYSSARVGDIAGGLKKPDGYWGISVDGFSHHGHRMAWFYVHGEWPKHQIDHINGVRTDNRLSNLRDVPPRVNSENKRRVVGASWEPESNMWRAQIGVKGKQKTIGRFPTQGQATAAYIDVKRRLHEGCTI